MKLLINAHGNTFKSKIKISKKSKIREDLFLYKENFIIPNKNSLKNERVNNKKAIFNSKFSKIYYKNFKKYLLPFLKKSNNIIYSLNRKMISKSLISFDVVDEKIEKIYSDKNNEVQMKKIVDYFLESKEAINKMIGEVCLISQKDKKLKLFQKINKFTKDSIDSILDKIAKINLKNQTKKTENKISKDFNLELKKINSEFKNLKNKFFFSNINKAISFYFEQVKNKKIVFLKNIWLIKYKFNFLLSNQLIDFLVENKSKSWELEYQFRKYSFINATEEEFMSEINSFLLGVKNKKTALKNIKINFSRNDLKESRKKIKIYKKELFEQYRKEIKITKFSKRNKVVRKKEIESLVKEKKYTFFNLNEYMKLKFSYKNYLAESILKIKSIRKKFSNEIINIKKTTPTEISNRRYWTSIFLGFLCPGFNSLFNRQYIKGIIQLLITMLIALLLSYSFGAFSSPNGNGIAGLTKLGASNSKFVLGETNGIVNDSRFFLVSGALGIIFLTLGIAYIIISFLDNITQNNLARLGVRYSNWKEQKKILKNSGLPYLISAPALLFILFIVVLPLVATILITFTNFGQKSFDFKTHSSIIHNGTTVPINWVGFDQFKYITVALNKDFISVFLWTIIWTLGATSLTLVIGTSLALIVNQKRVYGKTFWRLIYILPWAVPAFISIMFFSIFFSYDGIFNSTFSTFAGTDWKTGEDVYKTKILLIFLQAWLGHSYIFLLITGTVQSIPKSLYEASKVDGASTWKQFRKITLPLIVMQIAPLIIGQFTFNFNNFGIIYLFNEGGRTIAGHYAGATDIFISWIYKMINGSNPIPGAGAALSLIVSIFVVTPSAILFFRSKSFRRGDF